MVVQCFGCNKVRKFGSWIEVHPVIAEQMKGVEFIKTQCPSCQTHPIFPSHAASAFTAVSNSQ
jgi:hypothetical protein